MTQSATLSDMQLVLLSTAAARDSGDLLPIAPSLGEFDQRVRNSLGSLLKRELISEQRVGLTDPVWREDDDGRYGLRITTAGLAAINITDDEASLEDATSSEPQPTQSSKSSTPRPKEGSKAALLIALLERDGGATLDAITEATDWLPHSARAALTGLRKRGFAIASEKPTDGMRIYRIAGEVA